MTERQRAQQALEAERAALPGAGGAGAGGRVHGRPGSDGEWDFVSPHIEQMLGYPAHEWTENSAQWYAAIHPDDRERVMADEAQLDSPGDTAAAPSTA